MIQVVVLTLVASSSAFTTHRYDAYDNYRPITTLFSDIFPYGPGDARRILQTYENPRRHNDVRAEVYNQWPGINTAGAGRRVDTQYNYLNQYEWSNREVPWRAVVVTQRSNFNNKFNAENRDDATMFPSTEREPAEQQDTGEDINQTKDLNTTQADANDPQLNIQSGDVNRTLVINEQQITWNYEHNSSLEGNANITTRSINSNSNYSNSLQFSDVPSKPRLDEQYKRTKPNNEVVNNSTGNVQNNVTDEDSSHSNRTQNSDDKDTAKDNMQRTNNNVDEDRWIWSNGEVPAVETTTIALDDRAAFSGGACPSGKVRVGSMCVSQE